MLPSYFTALKHLLASVLILFTLPTLAQAEYLYQYTGNIFTLSTTVQNFESTPDGQVILVPYTETHEARLIASVFSPTLLTSGSVLNSNIHFSITGFQEFNAPIELIFPVESSPFPDYLPRTGGSFSFDTVGANYLPTQWNITIDQYVFLGGRGHQIGFTTSTNLDSFTGYDEPYVVFSGSLADNPGSWKVSVVPEPESYAMLLAGLGLIGYSVRRHRANIKS